MYIDEHDLMLIKSEILQIEKWSGEAYYTPENCPDGDEIYRALEKIKNILKIN